MTFFALDAEGRIPPAARKAGLGVSLAWFVLLGLSWLIQNRTLALLVITAGSLWLSLICLWLAVAGMRWAQKHTRHRDFGKTMFLILFTVIWVNVAFALMYFAVGDFTGACTFTDPEILGREFDRQGCSDLAFGDALYFSVVTITSLGYGDLQPHGLTRFIAGVEAIAGFMLMGLTISFLYAVLTADDPPTAGP